LKEVCTTFGHCAVITAKATNGATLCTVTGSSTTIR